jgi:pimeloyl-ACP methyl ester carboxylesterase
LQDANVDKCHFWGTHTGAGVGLLLACSDPSLILSLVLESPVIPGRALPSVANLFTNVSKVARTKGIAEAREFWWQEGAWFDVMRARTADCRATEHRQIIESFNGYPWLDAEAVPPLITPIDDSLRKIESPVLIINGEFDLPDFIAAADALEQCIPRCHRFNVEEAGGFPLWEFPERVNEYVSGFLRNFVIAEKSH